MFPAYFSTLIFTFDAFSSSSFPFLKTQVRCKSGFLTGIEFQSLRSSSIRIYEYIGIVYHGMKERMCSLTRKEKRQVINTKKFFLKMDPLLLPFHALKTQVGKLEKSFYVQIENARRFIRNSITRVPFKRIFAKSLFRNFKAN